MTPIIHRELITILRTRKAFALQVAITLFFTLLVVLRWPSDARVELSGANSQQVFRLFAYGLLAAVTLLVPIFPATTIVMERRRGTLALLLNSPLKPWAIYAGKLAGVFAFAVLLLALSLPAASACYAMGGVSLTHQLVILYGLLLVVTLQYATLAMWVSSLTNSADAAVRVTYGCVLGLSVVSLAPFFFLQGGEGSAARVAEWLRCLSPIPAVMQIVGHGDVGMLDAGPGAPLASRFLLLAGLTTLAFAGLTIYRLQSNLLDRARSSGAITDDQTTGVRAARRVIFLVDPRRRTGHMGNWTNPVMVKEFRSRRFGRSHWMLRLVGGCAIVSLLLAFSVTTGGVQWEMETMAGPLVLLQAALMVVFIPSLAAGLVSHEQESGTWPLLRSTPLSPGVIVRGKLLSVAWPMLLMLSATLPGYAVMMYIQPTLWLQVVRALLSLALAGLLALMLSATVGSWFRRTATATTAAYIAVMLVFVGTMLVWLARDAPFGHRTVETVLTGNAMAAALAVFNVPGFQTYQLTPSSWYFTAGTIAVLAIVLRFRVWRLTRPD
ncbi:ABC transporter permease [Candidatus Laterigemmans baculatus]|uniref:ABC transporter permease n=1 Tax=Candidatus Laterigemmans baculatus TaxID=2770505 RepID=UPI00193BAA4B|nr:ABC transporter permease subunit [Candidatus Laterigemmans baculatus]